MHESTRNHKPEILRPVAASMIGAFLIGPPATGRTPERPSPDRARIERPLASVALGGHSLLQETEQREFVLFSSKPDTFSPMLITKRHSPRHHKKPTRYWYGSTSNYHLLNQEGRSNAKLAFNIGVRKGLSHTQIGCMENVSAVESHFITDKRNSASGAYGIPQALPGSKMASAGADWQTNPATQIRWEIRYQDERYGSPCGAEMHENEQGWY